jgi:hypothetical protein
MFLSSSNPFSQTVLGGQIQGQLGRDLRALFSRLPASTLGRRRRRDHAVLDRAAHHDDAARTGPAGERQAVLAGLPALSGIDPVGAPELALDEALDVGRLPELEQIVLVDVFELDHHSFGAERAVAAHQLRTPIRGQAQDQFD